MKENCTQGVASLDPRGVVGRIYVGDQYTGGNVVRGDQKLCKGSPYESIKI